MHKKHNTQKRKGGARRRQPRGPKTTFPLTKAPTHTRLSSVGIQPQLDVTLSFQVFGTTLNAAGSVAMRRFRPNALYDVDPILGSTTVPNFVEISSLYIYNRVIAVNYDISVCNNETFPLNAYIIFSNSDPGTLGHIQLQGNRLCRQKMISAKGGMDRCTLKGGSTVSNIVGTNIESEDNYRGTSSAVPVDNIWLGIGAYSPSLAFLPNGITMSGTIKMRVRFFDPIANIS